MENSFKEHETSSHESRNRCLLRATIYVLDAAGLTPSVTQNTHRKRGRKVTLNSTSLCHDFGVAEVVRTFGRQPRLYRIVADQGGDVLKHRGTEITEKRREADSVSSVPLCFYLLHRVYSLLTSSSRRLNRRTLKTFGNPGSADRMWPNASGSDNVNILQSSH